MVCDYVKFNQFVSIISMNNVWRVMGKRTFEQITKQNDKKKI